MDPENLFNVQELTEVRTYIHKYAEPSFKEYKTSAKIRSFLLSKGVHENSINQSAKTGLIIDIKGEGPLLSDRPRIVAFRADMDALIMQERNPNLP